MRKLKFLTVYIVLAWVANTTVAQTVDIGAFATGDLQGMIVHSAPREVAQTEFTTQDGKTVTLSDYKGQVLLVNFWATWCPPCKAEMPSLAALQSDFQSDDFQVMTIATGPNPKAAMTKFFKDIQVDNLPLHVDPRSKMARSMQVLALPVTVLIDRDGHEIARFQGEADWNGETARSLIGALTSSP